MSNIPIVAEIGANHGGRLSVLIDTLHAAARAGVDAVKIQTWGTMCVSDYTLESGPWAARGLADLYNEAKLPWEWHQDVAEVCEELGLAWWSSPFDAESVEFLETLGCPRYKIASFEIVDLELIAVASQTQKPLIISTGMASWDEINDAVAAAYHNGCVDLTLLKCTSAYPAPASEVNLGAMQALRSAFDCKVGLSDHTLGTHIAVAAVALGADMVEKHFGITGLDTAFSIDEAAMKVLVQTCREARSAMGHAGFRPTPSEAEYRKLRRSLYIGGDLPAGHVLAAGDMVSARPALGLSPAHLQQLIGRRLASDTPAGTPTRWELFA